MTKGKVATAFRIPPDLYAALGVAATDHGVSINTLVTRAVNDYLSRLLPASEVRWTRDETTNHKDHQ